MIGKLSLDQLLVLVTIADTGSFSSAGRKLDRAQSAISQMVATLEGTQGVVLFDRSGHRPKLTDIGQVLVAQARLVLEGSARFEAVAANSRAGLESELVLAIDPLVPTAPLIDSLRALGRNFPDLPVSFSTEGLGGSLRRLRSGSAALAICLLLPAVPEDIIAYPLLRIRVRAACAPGHPLASLGRPASVDDLAPHVQLVLSDPVDPGGANYGLSSARLWRFVDLARRLDFLLAGFVVPHAGTSCRRRCGQRPAHLARNARRSDAAGRLVDLCGPPARPNAGPCRTVVTRRSSATALLGQFSALTIAPRKSQL